MCNGYVKIIKQSLISFPGKYAIGSGGFQRLFAFMLTQSADMPQFNIKPLQTLIVFIKMLIWYCRNAYLIKIAFTN